MMAEILVGTSGYSFDDWVGNFYPAGQRKGDMLSFYSRFFNTVEVNSTYYRIPHPAVIEQMQKKTPPGFVFILKANKAMTHESSPAQSVFTDFLEVCKPLIREEKFGGILAQFPWSFKNTGQNQKYLVSLRERLLPHPLFVEFRNVEWTKDEVFQVLEKERIGYCSVDEPSLKGLVPPIARSTTDIGYVRLHGRNAKNWWAGGVSDRYDYLYSDDELKGWLSKIKDLARVTEKTYVFFNNCHAGQAARNAQLMKTLLKMDME
jgi:uncharacterized protein YecE (DUF72 family)